jgi:hypothetical protein
MSTHDEFQDLRRIIEDIFMAAARLNTWMGEVHHDEHSSAHYHNVLDSLTQAMNRLNAMRAEDDA